MPLLCIMFSTQWKRFSILFFPFALRIPHAAHFWHSSNSFVDIFLPFSTDLTVSGLGMVHVTIPNAIQSGRNAILTCEYELENDDLYSVKWYKGKELRGLPDGNVEVVAHFYDVNILSSFFAGKREFFRYTPKEIPSIKIFKLPGIPLRVDVS